LNVPCTLLSEWLSGDWCSDTSLVVREEHVAKHEHARTKMYQISWDASVGPLGDQNSRSSRDLQDIIL